MRAMILLATVLLAGCRDVANQRMDSSAAFLEDHLHSYKEEYGEYPRDLEAFVESDGFLQTYPEDRISILRRLLDTKSFDYGGSDPSKRYLFRYEIGNHVRTFPKL